MKQIRKIALLTAGWTCEYHTRIIKGICKKAKEEGYAVSVFVCQDGTDLSEGHREGEYQIFSLPELRDYDGAILFTETISSRTLKERVIKKLKESAIPAVSLSEEIEGMGFVGIDDYISMSRLMEHVYEAHDCRILHFVGGWETDYATHERLRAFVDYTARHNHKIQNCRIWYSDYSFGGGYDLARTIAECGSERPDVIICANDKMAIGIMTGLQALGYRVPEDVMVTGFDGSYDTQMNAMRVTTVERPMETLGCRACEALIHMIDTGKADRIIMDTAIAVRERARL